MSSDEHLYLAAARELDSPRKSEGLWIKALALSDGDEQKARHRYIELRAQQFIAIEQSRATAPSRLTPADDLADAEHKIPRSTAQRVKPSPPDTSPLKPPSTQNPTYPYVDPTKRTQWVFNLLLFGVLVVAVSLWGNYREYGLFSEIQAGAFTSTAQLEAAAEANDQRQGLISLAYFAWFIVTAIVFLMWVYRLNANLRARGNTELRFTPGWTVGWYFVPVLNLWKPYQAMKEMMHAYSGSAPNTIVHWWWGLWVFSLIFNWFVWQLTSLMMTNPSLEQLISASQLSIATDAIMLIEILVALALVSEIKRITEPATSHTPTKTPESGADAGLESAGSVPISRISKVKQVDTSESDIDLGPMYWGTNMVIGGLIAFVVIGGWLYFILSADSESPTATETRTTPPVPTSTTTPTPPPQPATTRYQVHGSNNDIIKDTTTGLYWMRCSVGQSWNGRTCIGEANRYTWEQAQQIGHSGWRLPTIDELRTLVYCSSGQPAQFKNNNRPCSGNYQQPTIVTEAFPGTPSLLSYFWSSSPSANSSSFAWYVSFDSGFASNFDLSAYVNFYHLRLVHDGW